MKVALTPSAPRTSTNRSICNTLVGIGLLTLPRAAQAQFSTSNQTIAISGSAVTWSGSNYNIGAGTNHDTLAISNGGSLAVSTSGKSLQMGVNTASDIGNAITVDGAGSTLTVNGPFTLGVYASNNSLTISNGGTMSVVWNTTVGQYGSSGTNSITITGANSQLTVANMSLNSGSSNSISVLNGGKLTNSANFNIGNWGALDTVTISGAGSVFNQSSNTSTGLVTIGNTYTGAPDGNNALIIGAGATMNLTSSGTAVAGIAIVGKAGTTGNKLQIDGGTLNISTTSTKTPYIDVQNGAMILNSGSVTTPILTATTGATSVVTFNGGTLTTQSTTISNGSAFTIGNGTSVAKMILNGGSHSFANGLAVSTNATLTGTATVNGAVTASGTVAGSLTFANDVTLNSGATATASAFNGNIIDNGNITTGFAIASGKTLSGSGTANVAVTGTSVTINGSGLTLGATTLHGSSTLSGANSASTMTIADGTTTLSGTTTGAFNVSSGATLAGSGKAEGTVAVTSGTINGSGLRMGATTFSGASTVSGNASASSIAVAGGTTSVTGGVTTTGTLSVSSGATLTNNGTVTGAVNVTGLINGTGTIAGSLKIKSTGELSPGNSPGVTTVTGALVVESGAKVSMQIDGLAGAGLTAGYDQIVVENAGTVTLDSGSVLSLTLNTALAANTTITLIDNESTSAISGKFTEVAISGSTYDVSTNNSFIYNDQQYALSYTATSGTDGIGNDLTLSVVPEPSTWAMIVGGLGTLVGCQRLRRRQASNLS